MEKNPEKDLQGEKRPEINPSNLSALRGMALELRETHQLSSEAIARILHIDSEEVEEVLKERIS